MTKLFINGEIITETQGSFYDKYYSCITPEFINSRSYGAIAKCESIVRLAHGIRHRKVLEVGSGLGSIIKRLNELDFATEYYIIEISPSAARYIAKQEIPNLQAIYVEDVQKSQFPDETFDLAILSHVLEHVTNPEPFLTSVLRIAKHVIVEVPLENNLTENSYALFRKIKTGLPREKNVLGHINYFNKKTLSSAVKDAGGLLLKQRNYRPRSFAFSLHDTVFYLLYKGLGPYVIGSHHAVLLKKGYEKDPA